MLPLDEQEVTLGEHYGFDPGKKEPVSDSLITNDFIGVEIELEQANRIDPPSGWTAHSDGSLRNNGIEYVFAGPQNGRKAARSLKAIEDRMLLAIAGGHRPDAAVRSSVHIHVDVNDLTATQLSNVLALYTVFEIPLFKAFAESRMGSHFCHPFHECLELSQAFYWLRQGWDTFENNVNIPRIGRYCAFNLKSIFKFGTIEFRHHGGTWNYDALMLWVNACLSFKRAASTNIDFVNDFFKTSAVGYEDSLRRFFPRDVVEKIFAYYNNDIPAFNSDVSRGVITLQNLVTPRIRI